MRRGPAVLLLLLLLFACAYGAQQAIALGWRRVTEFTPSHFQAPRPTAGNSPLAGRVVLILLDGLRPEDAPYLPALDLLRRQGSGFDLTAPAPVYGAPALATMLTGTVSTLHGAMLDGPPHPLPADHLALAAARVRAASGGVGGKTLGALLGPSIGQWTTAASPQQVVESARQLLAPTGPRLVLIQLDQLHREGHSLKGPTRANASFRDVLASLDAQLVQILEPIDLKTTAVLVTGVVPTDAGGDHPADGRIPLILAGAGVKEGLRSEATLPDLAPTVSVLLGAPMPLQTRGRPLLEVLNLEGRPADTVAQRYLSVRRSFADTQLQALGSLDLAPEEPATAKEGAGYLAQLEQQVQAARWEYWKKGVVKRLPSMGGIMLLTLLYLLLAFRQPFGFALFMGVLAYGAAFHLIFFLSGGRYSAGLAGLEGLTRNLTSGLGLRTALAMTIAAGVSGFFLSRREFRRPVYLTTASLHGLLVLVTIIALPMAVGVLFTGWEFPVELPAPGLWVWFFVTGIQVVVIGYMSPIWVGICLLTVRFTRQVWPLKDVGDPERNADKVVRLRTLRRPART